MTARTGMANLILQLRNMTSSGTADYTVDGVDYWTEDQLEDVLDRHRTNLHRVPLVVQDDNVGGSVVYHDYFVGHNNLEEESSGTAAWQLENSAGSVSGTANWTANYDVGHIRFTNNQKGTAYYLTARTFDLNKSAVEVWRAKAASVHSYFDYATDGQRLTRSQWFEHCISMADYYKREIGLEAVTLDMADWA